MLNLTTDQTEDEIAVKFNALGKDVIGDDQPQKLHKAIMNIGSAKYVTEFLELTIAC